MHKMYIHMADEHLLQSEQGGSLGPGHPVFGSNLWTPPINEWKGFLNFFPNEDWSNIDIKRWQTHSTF